MEDAPPDELARPLPRRRLSTRVVEWVSWFGAGRLAVTAASIVAITVGGYLLVRVPRPPVEAGLPRATAASTQAVRPVPTAASTPATIVVHVAGAVGSPGLYHLPGAARVDDAVTAAGGMTAGADPAALNLATPLRDGMRVYVPTTGEAVPPVAEPSDPTDPARTIEPVNLNTASAADLDDLPGVGPATAAAIVAYRGAHGPFASVDDLAEVRGIGQAKLDVLRPLVTT